MKFQYIADYSGSLTRSHLCRLMGVTERGLHAWKHRPPSQRQRRDMVLLAHIRDQHRLSLGSYGRPRMTEELNELGLQVGQRRVGRLMRQNGIQVVRTRKFKATTDSRHDFPVADNLLQRRFGTRVKTLAAVIFLITPLETAGDLTANSIISKQPVKGPLYMRRIKSGVLADGCNSAMAAMFNSLPMTTFSQNNGVIQLTGVASRYVAFFIAGLLVLLGLFPMIGAVLQLMPKPVLGGAELVMFGTVAVAGIKILAEAGLHRRNMLIVAISLGMGLGIAAVPEVLRELPQALRNIFESPITVGALCAIVLNIFLPEEFMELEEDDFDPEASILQVMENPDLPAKAEPASAAAGGGQPRQAAAGRDAGAGAVAVAGAGRRAPLGRRTAAW